MLSSTWEIESLEMWLVPHIEKIVFWIEWVKRNISPKVISSDFLILLSGYWKITCMVCITFLLLDSTDVERK